MGHNYTIIKINDRGKLEKYEIDDLNELYSIADINEDTLIVEGNAKVKSLKEDKKYAKYYENFRAGLKAEIEFYKMMSDKKYFIERIDQSKESIQKYIDTAHEEYSFIKRPDFVVLGENICFEVKCYTNKKITLREHFGLQCFQKNTGMNVYLIIYEKQGDDIAKDENGEAKYFIVKNDDIYNSRDKDCYDKKTKSCLLDQDGLKSYTSIDEFLKPSKQKFKETK